MDAAVLEAPLTECALNIEVSIPVFSRISFNQLASRCEVTGLWGLIGEVVEGFLGWSPYAQVWPLHIVVNIS